MRERCIAAAHRGRRDPDRAQISQAPAQTGVRATRIVRKEDARWVFGDDIDVATATDVLPLAPDDGSEIEGPWPTSCLAIVAPTDRRVLRGTDLVLAAHPHACGLYDSARFRGKLSGKTAMRNARLRDARRHPEGPIEYVRRMRADLFGNDSKRYISRCIDPQRASRELVSGYGAAMALLRPDDGDAPALPGGDGPKVRYAACDDAEVAHAEIYAGPAANARTMLAESGVLRVGPREGFAGTAHRASSQMDDAGASSDDELEGSGGRLSLAQDKADEMLQLATWLALAGQDDGPAWRGRPVEQLVSRIYRDLLGALGKRAVRREAKHVTPAASADAHEMGSTIAWTWGSGRGAHPRAGGAGRAGDDGRRAVSRDLRDRHGASEGGAALPRADRGRRRVDARAGAAPIRRPGRACGARGVNTRGRTLDRRACTASGRSSPVEHIWPTCRRS